MKRKWKQMSRIISAFLAAVMIVTSMPQSVLTVNAAEVSGALESNEALSEAGTQESGDSEIVKTEGEASGDDLSKDGIAEGDSSGDNALGEDSSEGNILDEENPDNGTSNEGKSDDETSDEGKSDDDAQDKDKNEGEISEDGDTSGEDDGKEDAGQVDDEESQDGEEDGEEADSVDEDNEEKLDSEEQLLDYEEDEKKPVNISFHGSMDSYTVYDEKGNDITQNGFTVPYGSSDILRFKIVPEVGYTLTIWYDDFTWAGIALSKTEVNGGYECTISPMDEENGYTYSMNIGIEATKKSGYKLTFIYSSEDVEELVLTNNPKDSTQQVVSSVPIRVTNEYGTSFKLKAKAGKSLAVSYESEDGENHDGFYKYYEDAGNGYYNFDLGKMYENAIITIKDGWKINFEYNDDEIEELHRLTLRGSEEDVSGGDDMFDWNYTINHTEVVVKGEVLYFDFYSEEYFMCNKSVTDNLGNIIDRIGHEFGESSSAYKVIPTADMTIKIEFIPRTLPVTYVDGVVKNISITAKDEDGETYDAYDDGKKEIINIHSDMTQYNISFEIAEGKHFDRAEIVNNWKNYDDETGEWQDDYSYYKINLEQSADGTYTSVEPFTLDNRDCELRIIADDVYTVTFAPSDEVSLYADDDYEMTNALSGDTTIVKDFEYRFRITFDMEYKLATPYVIAESNGEKYELEVGEGYPTWHNNKKIYVYNCSITPTSDTKISVFLKQKSIPFKYDKSALKNIEIGGQSSAKLSEDGKSININRYEELTGCEIKFALEADKAVIGAYYAYTGRVWAENYGWTSETCTYTEYIPVLYDDGTQLYMITLKMPEVDDNRVISIDYIQIVAGDKCEISFEGDEGKAEIFDFNSYVDIPLDSEQPIEAVKNGEYLFRVELLKEYGAASCHVTTEDGKELPVKYYSIHEPHEERPIQYYSFTPTEDVSKVYINLSPLSIAIKYSDSAVKNLALTQYGEEPAENAPVLSSDRKTVSVWSYDYGLPFDLELESDHTLSRIFSRRYKKVDDDGNNIDGYYEDDITYITYDTVDDKYHFEVIMYYDDYGSDLFEIEIVTDKVNLSKCNVELKLDYEFEEYEDEKGDKFGYGYYYAAYRAEEIEPEVTVKYEVEEGKTETLDRNWYTVTYENNRNVGEAHVIITAKDGSDCTGSNEAHFKIMKAQAPEIAPLSIFVDVNDTKENRELNLSNRVLVDTVLGEKDVKPTRYIVDTENATYTNGGVLADYPSIDSQSHGYEENKEYKEVWTHTLIYSIDSEAKASSDKAVIVLTASFENYNDAKVVIEVSMAEKTEIILDGYALNRIKKYDAKPYSYDFDNVYVVDENGLKHEDSDKIMAELKDSIKFHYKGNEYTSQGGNRTYDSYEAPVNAGNYTLILELSEENKKYTAAPYEVGYFSIRWRDICVRADSVTLNVGDPLPDKYSYRITGDELLDGDKISSEPTLSCDADNTDMVGKYRITVDTSDMDICNSDGESVGYYYSIDYYDAWLTISSVVKNEITLSQKNGTQLTKTYDGEAFDGTSLIEAKKDETPVTDAKITVKYTGRGSTVYIESEKAPVNVGTYTMKAKVASSDGQYKSEELSLDIEITKAAAPVFKEQVINLQPVTENTTGMLDITQYLSGYEVESYGTVDKADENGVLAGNAEVDAQGVLSYTLKAGVSTGTAVLTIPLVFRNYGNADMTVKIMLTSKTLLTLSKAEGVEVNKEYDGNSYVLPAEAVTVSGMTQGEPAQPKLDYVYTLRGSADSVQPIHAGQYMVTVTVADDDDNYIAQTPLVIDFEITKKTVNVKAKSGEWNKTFDLDERPTATEYPHGYETDGLVGSDNLISGPASYTYTYTSGKDTVTIHDTDDEWNALKADTVITVTPSGAEASEDYEINYVSGTLTVTDIADGEEFIVENIKPMVYTGSQLKPNVKVYARTNGGLVELSAKDYKVTYGENKNAGKGTVMITGKGNYDKEIIKYFTIEKASIGNGNENNELGITLKYTEQALPAKDVKLVTSLKYKKALKEGIDFTVTLTKDGAAEGTEPVSMTNGTVPAKSPKGDDKVVGTYTLLIEAMDNSNYSGCIEKKVYIAGKDNLLKNAKITLKKKSLKWDDKDTANYVNYNKENWGGFYLIPGSSKDDAKDFTVSIGTKYLTNNQTSVSVQDEGSQYFISYTNNDQAGTATITVTGDGETYFGTKSATFKIQGTPFKFGTQTGNIEMPDTLTASEFYTGKEITKDISSLKIVGKTGEAGSLTGGEGQDYTVTYANNVKKGNASVIITANPKSGYSGSIKKNFKIMPADLTKAIENVYDGKNPENIVIIPKAVGGEVSIAGIVYEGPVPYSKSGATISGLVFTNREGVELKAGTDYTVKYTYTDNKDKKAGSSAKMTLNGKGNYSGTVDVDFKIGKAAYSDLEVSVAPVKLGNKAVKPKVTVKDGKKALTVSEDGSKEVKITYANNEPVKVQAWLTWLASGTSEGSSTAPAAPTVTIEIVNNANYEQTLSDTRTLNVYSDKMDKNKLTINWRDPAKITDFIYNNGEQVKPGITSIKYDHKIYTVMAVGKDYYAYDGNNVERFKITYGANNKSGKNAGSVTIEGLKLCGGKYTEKFEIKRKDISKK